MTSHRPRAALITGASRGLGLALARALAERGWTLILDARGAEALEAARAELARRTHVVAVTGDVTDPAHREALAAAARSVMSSCLNSRTERFRTASHPDLGTSVSSWGGRRFRAFSGGAASRLPWDPVERAIRCFRS